MLPIRQVFVTDISSNKLITRKISKCTKFYDKNHSPGEIPHSSMLKPDCPGLDFSFSSVDLSPCIHPRPAVLNFGLFHGS